MLIGVAIPLVQGARDSKTCYAFERTITSDGTPVTWFTRCIPIWLGEAGAKRISFSQLEADLVTGLARWSDEECADLTVSYQGVTSSRQVGYDVTVNTQNQNIVLFQSQAEDWVHDPRVVALTTVTICQNETPQCSLGTIIDADIELNEAAYTFTSSQARIVQMDSLSILTHELGHFLGLDHSPIEAATMYYQAFAGEIDMRDLHSDDVEGICSIFAVEHELACDLAIYDLKSGTPQPLSSMKTSSEEGCTQSSPHVLPLWLVCALIFLYTHIKRSRDARLTSH